MNNTWNNTIFQNQFSNKTISAGDILYEVAYQSSGGGLSNITNITAEQWGSELLYINWKHILKIWRERCDDLHGRSPEQIEAFKKRRQLEEMQHIQKNNTNLEHTKNEWIFEDSNELLKINSKALATWIYGAKIISKTNQIKIK
jgi:hypothetical protein